MKIKNVEEFNELINKEHAVVDFYAEWCGPCRMLGPVVEKIQNDHPEYNLMKLDIDEFADLAEKYNVQSVPTIIYFKNGKEVDRSSGFMAEDILIERITKNI